MVKQGVTHILVNDSTVQALVGRNVADTKYKCYPVVCPEPEKFPYSVVRTTGKVAEECKRQLPTSFTYSFDVYTFHKSSKEVEELNTAIINALISSSGVQNSISFDYIRFVTTRDDYEANVSGGLFVKISSFEAYVNESPST